MSAAYSFKDMLQNDLAAVFINPDEFGEPYMVEGTEVILVMDEDTLKERQSGRELGVGAELGIAEATLLFHAKAEDLPSRKDPGATLNLDGRLYTVEDWQEDMGLATVALSQPDVI